MKSLPIVQVVSGQNRDFQRIGIDDEMTVSTGCLARAVIIAETRGAGAAGDGQALIALPTILRAWKKKIEDEEV
jgi:hypothetical protein